MKKIITMALLALTSMSAVNAAWWEEAVEVVKEPVEKVEKAVLKPAPKPVKRIVEGTKRDIAYKARKAAEAQRVIQRGIIKPVPQTPALSPAQRRRQRD